MTNQIKITVNLVHNNYNSKIMDNNKVHNSNKIIKNN